MDDDSASLSRMDFFEALVARFIRSIDLILATQDLERRRSRIEFFARALKSFFVPQAGSFGFAQGDGAEVFRAKNSGGYAIVVDLNASWRASAMRGVASVRICKGQSPKRTYSRSTRPPITASASYRSVSLRPGRNLIQEGRQMRRHLQSVPLQCRKRPRLRRLAYASIKRPMTRRFNAFKTLCISG